jgi:hypothetical protein
MADNVKPWPNASAEGVALERQRLREKAQGVKLALSYFDEMTREKGFTENES